VGRAAIAVHGGAGPRRRPDAAAEREIHALERGREAILCGESAERLAADRGLALVGDEELIVERQRERWRRRSETASSGTVGAVALDHSGALAAATSTGGRPGRPPGASGTARSPARAPGPVVGVGVVDEGLRNGQPLSGDTGGAR